MKKKTRQLSPVALLLASSLPAKAAGYFTKISGWPRWNQGCAWTDSSNRDSKKGIPSNRQEPYPPLLELMKRVSERAFGLVNYFNTTAHESSR